MAPVSDPQALGFSSARLDRIAAWQQSQFSAGAFSGAVAAIAKNGRVAYLRAVGFRDNAKTIPLQSDAIFRIASMTKPVTAIAAMILVEEGKLDLAAPVYHYIPELKDMMVAIERKDPVTGATELKREPQKRPMTVEDLLRHTAGLVLRREDIKVIERVLRPDKTLADFVAELAKLPLAYQPGEVWAYSSSFDVLGRVIEVASDQPLDRFLENRLFKPLGMVDTGFWVPPEKVSRLIDRPGGRGWIDWDVTKPTTLFRGGGGLMSTAADYLRFCQMLLNGGELDGVRILKAATVRRMTTNALPPGIRFAGDFSYLMGPQAGSTYGLGFAVRNDPDRSLVPGSVGSFSWDGILGTYFWVDPGEQLIAVQLIQVAPETGGRFYPIFRDLTYGALGVPGQGVPASAPVTIDAATLGTYAGTYGFSSISSRDRQEPFGGLGIGVGMEDGRAKVLSAIPYMPAAKAGIMANDIVTHIDDEPLQGLTLSLVLEKMRGPVNTTVRLRIRRNGNGPIEVSIVRAPIKVSGAALQVAVKDGKLFITATGTLPILDFDKGAPVAVTALSENEFFVDGGEHTRLAFERDEAGRPARLVLNPGPWQITGQRID
ncbi:MAG TPA: serine hydrolase [Xanthobacteraceae bacterium]|nr:serine hydrolase [Xanthobacteraceae bacterium]